MITFLRLGDYGRLGNQLFQIAATLGLASRTGRQPIFPEWEFAPWLNVRTTDTQTLQNTNWVTLRPESFRYDPSLAESDAENVNLEGYFQSEKYFAHVGGLVRDAIMSEVMQRLSDEVAGRHDIADGNDCCAVHVRRGDYVKFSDLYCQLSPDRYYRPAMEMLRKTGVRRFILVSDDPAWCRQVLAGEGIEFSRNTGTQIDRLFNSQRHRDHARRISSRWSNALASYASVRVLRDLLLMARCRHHIIANSSFSWWSSWLSPEDRGMVIAPRRWFTERLAHDTSDLYRPDMTLL